MCQRVRKIRKPGYSYLQKPKNSKKVDTTWLFSRARQNVLLNFSIFLHIFRTAFDFPSLGLQKAALPSFLHSLKRFDEFPGLDGWRVDDLVDVLAVAVCIGGGDVNEGLEVVHLLGQAEELLRGDHVQLQGVSAGKREKKKRKTYCQTVCVCEIKCVCV